MGTIGTEPHSLLFGFDCVFPMGYNATIKLDNNEIVSYLNKEITNPDAVILCINYHDEVEYIRNTMYTLMGLTDTKVIALVMYPVTLVKDWNGVYGISKRKVTAEEYEEKSQYLTGLFRE